MSGIFLKNLRETASFVRTASCVSRRADRDARCRCLVRLISHGNQISRLRFASLEMTLGDGPAFDVTCRGIHLVRRGMVGGPSLDMTKGRIVIPTGRSRSPEPNRRGCAASRSGGIWLRTERTIQLLLIQHDPNSYRLHCHRCRPESSRNKAQAAQRNR